jgi:hypothetical protein
MARIDLKFSHPIEWDEDEIESYLHGKLKAALDDPFFALNLIEIDEE